MNRSVFDRVAEAVGAIQQRVAEAPRMAIVLGSGLGAIVDLVTAPVIIEYRDLPHFPRPAVEGHAGRLVLGRIADRPLAILDGRAHLYEGHSFDEVVFATRVMGQLGVEQLVLTTAAGAINPTFAPGTIMVIDDHLNLLGGNPLVGTNDERFGPRFPDMADVYSTRLRALADDVAGDVELSLTHGVYAAVTGPCYETPAEVRYLRTIGADAVGMSTVPEAIAGRHMGLDVFGLSCITNVAGGIVSRAAEPIPSPQRHPAHADVLTAARASSGKMAELLHAMIAAM
jgi:purine-nucleoside phosphorylase